MDIGIGTEGIAAFRLTCMYKMYTYIGIWDVTMLVTTQICALCLCVHKLCKYTIFYV